MTSTGCVLALVTASVVVAAGAARAAAQPPEDGGPDPSVVRMRIGPVLLNPVVELTNLGIDTNVFDEPADQNPKRDFTMTATPKTDLWLRMGRSWLSATIAEHVVWYQEYASERTTNTDYLVGWKLPLARLVVSTSGKYIDTRERPGYEIDVRAGRREYLLQGNAEVRGFAKTFFTLGATRQRVKFDADASFLGMNLDDELTHTTTASSVGVRYAATSLTSIAVTATRSQDRFDFSSLRDSDSTSVMGSVVFDPAALIKGSVSIGYRSFRPIVPGLPNYDGAAASADLSYTLLEMTRFAFQATRDLQYSYDVTQPYYIQTGARVSVTQQIYGPVEAGVRYGAHRLAYRDREGVAVAAPNRVDTVHMYGGSVGYRVGRDLHVTVNLDRQTRMSPLDQRRYEGLRIGTAVTYGLQ